MLGTKEILSYFKSSLGIWSSPDGFGFFNFAIPCFTSDFSVSGVSSVKIFVVSGQICCFLSAGNFCQIVDPSFFFCW